MKRWIPSGLIVATAIAALSALYGGDDLAALGWACCSAAIFFTWWGA